MSCLFQCGGQCVRLAHQPHSATTAARRGLDHHRVANLGRDALRVGIFLDDSLGSGNGRHFGFLSGVACGGLVAQQSHRVCTGSYEFNVAGAALVGEGGVL